MARLTVIISLPQTDSQLVTRVRQHHRQTYTSKSETHRHIGRWKPYQKSQVHKPIGHTRPTKAISSYRDHLVREIPTGRRWRPSTCRQTICCVHPGIIGNRTLTVSQGFNSAASSLLKVAHLNSLRSTSGTPASWTALRYLVPYRDIFLRLYQTLTPSLPRLLCTA